MPGGRIRTARSSSTMRRSTGKCCSRATAIVGPTPVLAAATVMSPPPSTGHTRTLPPARTFLPAACSGSPIYTQQMPAGSMDHDGRSRRAWSQRELHDSQSAVYNHDRSTNEAGQERISRLPSCFLPKAQEPGIAALIAQCRASGTVRRFGTSDEAAVPFLRGRGFLCSND
jgi:hypothetical protein